MVNPSVKAFYLKKEMTELGLGTSFNNWFLRFPMNNRRMEPIEPAMTLKEFFELNSQFIRDPQQHFICNKDNEGFSIHTSSFERLKSFLLLKGFTQDDWIMLGERSKASKQAAQGNLFPFSYDKKSDLLKLRLDMMEAVKISSESGRYFLKTFSSKQIASPTIADILVVTIRDIEEITGTKGSWKLDSYTQVQNLRRFVENLQAKLEDMGFDSEDGSFMSISFKTKKTTDGLTVYMKKKLDQQGNAAA